MDFGWEQSDLGGQVADRALDSGAMYPRLNQAEGRRRRGKKPDNPAANTKSSPLTRAA